MQRTHARLGKKSVLYGTGILKPWPTVHYNAVWISPLLLQAAISPWPRNLSCPPVQSSATVTHSPLNFNTKVWGTFVRRQRKTTQSQRQDNSHLRHVALTDNTHPQYISQHTIKHDPIEHQHIEGQEPRVQKGTDDKLISEEKTEHLVSVHVIIPNFNTRR